jgi:hypothetical protein
MTARRKRSGVFSAEWFWRFRHDGSPVCVEQTEDNRWRIVIGISEIAVVASRDVAIEVVEELDAKAKGSVRD